ncbi:MAG: N-methyl-L-tryptophan oxidase [Vicinamibacterales bacterium]
MVVGAGGMGAAAAAHLATRGLRVRVFERFGLGHDRGSSHGLTRIIRLAYFEHPSYVPLLRRAYELWRRLEQESGERLLHVTGGLDVGAAGSRVFEGARHSCEAHDLPHEILEASELARRVPAWRPEPGTMAVFQPDGGFLAPERCVRAHAAAAVRAGARIHEHEPVTAWRRSGPGIVVDTARGAYACGQLVLAAGPWIGALLPELASLMAPERQVLGWFAVRDAALFAPERFPVFVYDAPEGLLYGFPEFDVPGFKIGRYHHRHEPAAPDAVARTCDATDEAILSAPVRRYFPGAGGPLLRATVCLFTNTPDGHFIVDRHPDVPEVLVVSPCSGHGFKFSSVIGELVADLVCQGSTVHDISPFRLARFAPG